MLSGQLYIVSAPSGAGKTTMLKRVIRELPGLSFSVSHTTRQPRANEEDGQDYFFVDIDSFMQMRDDKKFLEWAVVHGNFYGTSLESVTGQLEAGLDVILDIDIQGARQVRARKDLDHISIFIVPPSLDELEKRLSGRGTDEQATIDTRLANAAGEMADADLYDHLVVNDDLDEAVAMVKGVILAGRSRQRRGFSGAPLADPTARK